jgi:hypothetical protein
VEADDEFFATWDSSGEWKRLGKKGSNLCRLVGPTV